MYTGAPVKADRLARKGDLVAYQFHRSYTTTDHATERWSVWRLGTVEHASRDGIVRAIRQSGYNTVVTVTNAQGRRVTGSHVGGWAVAPRCEVDMDGLMADEELWGQDLDDLASVRAAIAQYRIR